jgi:hypothetical protein
MQIILLLCCNFPVVITLIIVEVKVLSMVPKALHGHLPSPLTHSARGLLASRLFLDHQECSCLRASVLAAPSGHCAFASDVCTMCFCVSLIFA